ncbi:hypothetical protein PR003_g30710 [Phytophthora rubi]|uniref:Uncharacterized protein n=1 Tax=Phytophthora rubi TaxID=129364 RepID=A0A6A3GXX2_9STRA|nr:hypothetical protein PR002_g29728 [Phytophthora rubi]KAE8973714.1 hypothetical protein PR001_g26229 [Phytophthora rubi]KAE9270806.1 hypothetical protein PR003_g30710 [Phytophthora rubi]
MKRGWWCVSSLSLKLATGHSLSGTGCLPLRFILNRARFRGKYVYELGCCS